MKVLRQKVVITDVGSLLTGFRIIEATIYRGKLCVRYSKPDSEEMYPEYIDYRNIHMFYSEQLKAAMNNLVRQFKLSQI